MECLLQITFDYPSEHIIKISGKYMRDFTTQFLSCITFYTNKGTYGPYAPPPNKATFDSYNFSPREFSYEIGGEFCGFFGTYKSQRIESIGFYMKPLRK